MRAQRTGPGYLLLHILLLCLVLSACVLPANSTSVPVPQSSPTAAVYLPALSNAAVRTPSATPADLLTPTDAALPAITPTPLPPSPTPTPQRRSVVVISWDGARADLINNWMADGSLPHFAELATQGVRAAYAQSIDPPLTAAAQNSIATGAYPSRTGLVSNAFHKAIDSFYWYRSGFEEPLDQAEPIWVTASKAGLKTATVFFTSSSLQFPNQVADYTIDYGLRDAYSRQEKISLTPVTQNTWQGEPPTSFSPPYEGNFFIFNAAQVFLYVFDSTDDNAINYDTVLLNTQRSLDTRSPGLKVGEWAPLVLIPQTTAGADFLIQAISPGEPFQVQLFYTNVYHNSASPRDLLQKLNQKFGFFPAGADSYALEKGWITPEDYLYLLERQALWMAQVTAWVKNTYQPDLLFTWQEAFDAAGHTFYMADPRQTEYSPEKASLYAGYMQRAAHAADQALGWLLDSAIDFPQDTVLLVSDHGMAPLHTVVYPNILLQQAGLLALDKRHYVIVEKTQAMAVASGGAAHIYINLQGDEKDGIVSASEYPQVLGKVIELLRTLTNPTTGEPVFQRVLRFEELPALGLNHPNAGDVFVQAFPGYALDDGRESNVVFAPAQYYGQHGYDSSTPEMHTIFLAAGAGISGRGLVIPPVRIVDYAPTIAFLLGFSPGANIDGQPVPAITSP